MGSVIKRGETKKQVKKKNVLVSQSGLQLASMNVLPPPGGQTNPVVDPKTNRMSCRMSGLFRAHERSTQRRRVAHRTRRELCRKASTANQQIFHSGHQIIHGDQ